MKQYDVLIVEDDSALCEALRDTLEVEGYRVMSALNGNEALNKLAKHGFKLVVSDVQMPMMDGLQLLHNMQMHYPATPVLLMTAYGTIPKAVEAMRSGAVDYLIKPFEAAMLVDKVAPFIVRETVPVQANILADGKMRQLYALSAKVAQTDVTVLLEGESGTGKEVLARYIHQQSRCNDGPFVAINCAAIPENMLEAMLFGYEKGAFTGAVQASAGKFEQAQGGTLLLDEISEMDLALQAKLLRVLQEKEIERLGSQKKVTLDVRILATTNRKLKDYVDQGRFREDLYYRLSVFPLRIPPLRERVDDILPLASELLQKHHAGGNNLPVFSAEAVRKMQCYRWPGNVRELENVVQRALILQRDGRIGADELIFEEAPLDVGTSFVEQSGNIIHVHEAKEENEISTLGEGVRSVEEKIILQTLNEVNGSRKMTAEKLGISPRTLRYKLARMKESGVALPC
ncbi:sigma-54-dependent transcriptional regulator [Methylomarinum vadi]|uniref:sigma-54-dependent transcriptional regulator n=1 Tax=Methylomarinum vadi TaxID=438855 RepID=UPI0004DF1863|nr:sigma-54 dependent transcriptional regulator [Methylomarinum vadi]